jgi:hypothetical protein
MSLHELSRRDWSGALERFSREHRGWLVTVDGRDETTVVERPLRSVDTEADSIVIRVGDAAPLHVDAPTALRVDENGLDIETADGVTRLRFRATALPEALDGIAPSER